MSIKNSDPHFGQPYSLRGPALATSQSTLILIHGRGSNAEDMLHFYNHLDVPQFSGIAPQAFNNTWYPRSFLSPVDQNQPYLDSALELISALVRECESQGVQRENIALLGFSQGACLTLEFAARSAARYAAIIGLSGGLIGQHLKRETYQGHFHATPIFLGSSDPDPHVPFSRVEESAEYLRALGAQVKLKKYPGEPHSINEDEVAEVRKLLKK